MARKITVLVVDDSAFVRKALRRMLGSDPAITVVGEADNGLDAIAKVKELKPEVVTLDVRMPEMDGLETLKRIMKERPTPVLMVSSVTSEGGDVTLKALEAGAVDFIDKSTCHTVMDITNIASPLIEKVKILAGVDINKLAQRPSAPAPAVVPLAMKQATGAPTHIVAVGASTGGPMALESVLLPLPADYPGSILIVQHMPPGFTASFADRLNHMCKVRVKEAEDGEPLAPATAYIGPGGYHLKIKLFDGKYKIMLTKSPRDSMHIPSVDEMYKSVAETWPGKIIGVIMTGMGSDGTLGAIELKKKGALMVGQNEETCVVFGMPKAAMMAGATDRMAPLEKLADEIVRFSYTVKYDAGQTSAV